MPGPRLRPRRQSPGNLAGQRPDLGAAAEVLIDWLEKHVGTEALAGVGHRVVHGGPHYHQPTTITAELIAELRRICPLDVDHLPRRST